MLRSGRFCTNFSLLFYIDILDYYALYKSILLLLLTYTFICKFMLDKPASLSDILNFKSKVLILQEMWKFC